MIVSYHLRTVTAGHFLSTIFFYNCDFIVSSSRLTGDGRREVMGNTLVGFL